METFGLYSLKAGIILALFGMIYHICLQKETFYRFNRFFLLFGMGIALLLPLYSVHYIVEVGTDLSAFLIEGIDYPEAVTTGTNEDSALLQLCYRFLPVIYITGISVLIIFRLFGFLHLLFAIRKNETKQYSNYNLIESSDFQGAFSFFRYIFISGQLQEYEKRIILKHEETHVRQKHWIDLVFINLLNLLWWFNPVIWLYEKAIRNNHEYLADQAVLTDHKQTEYQKTLVNQWFKVPVFPITNSFSYSNNLKRLSMMKKNTSNPVKQLFALIAIPALALFLWAFAEPEYVAKATQPETVTIHSDDSIQMTGYRMDNPKTNPDTPLEKPLIIIDGTKTDKEIKEIEKMDPAQIHEMCVLKDEFALDKYGEEGKNGVIEIITKKSEPITNPLESGKDTEIITELENRLVVINGEITDKSFSKLDINPEDIAYITVLKDKSAMQLYGEKCY